MKAYNRNKRYCPHEIATKQNSSILLKLIDKRRIFLTFAESIRYQKHL